MKATGYVIFIVTGLMLAGNVQGQSHEEIRDLKRIPTRKTSSPYLSYSKQPAGTTGQVTGWLFRSYKNFISSQDYGNCNFTPSCSEYAVIAIRKQGLAVGFVNTMDRLMRCHGQNRKHYPADPETGLLIDEVRDHTYERK